MLIFLFLSLLFYSIQSKAPLEYYLVTNISFPNITATKVISSNQLFLCSAENLIIYNSVTGVHTDTIDFTPVATGSTLKCLDAYENNTYCLFSKGTIMIRYDVQLKTYLTHDFMETGNTAGKLLLGGEFAVMNAPNTANIYILNYTTMVGLSIKPLSTAITAAYMLEVNIKGTQFNVFQGRRMFIYTYSTVTYSWTMVYNTSLTPFVGSSVYWVAYSPSENVFYNTRGNQIVQIRNATDYAVLSERSYANYTTITVSNIQFTNTLGDELSIQLYNSTSNTSFLQIYNITTGTSEYKNISDGKNTSFQSMKVYPSDRVMILYYDTYGCEVYELRCPVNSTYSSAEGMCLYCNQTTLCAPPVVITPNVTVNQTTNTTNQTNTITPTNTTQVNQTNTTIPIQPTQNLTNNTSQQNTTNLTNDNTTLQNTSSRFTQFQQQAIQLSGRFYSIPTIRQSLKSFSYLFLAMDSLWMYQYHNRTYGDNVQNIFESVRRIQDMKFSFFSIIGSAYEFLTNTESQIQSIANCMPYTSPQYLKAQNKDGSFLSNSMDFILFHIPGTLMSFILCRWLFFRISGCKFGSILKLYSFWGYFLMCLLEPNVEYFSFLLGNEFHLSFYFNYLNKIFAIIWINCLFLIIFFSVILIIFLKYLYGDKVKLFMENTLNKGMGIGWILFTMTIKRMFTGICHSYLYYYPTQQLICLIIGESFELGLMFFLWKKFKLFPEHIAVWARMLINLIMIAFQLCLLLKSYLQLSVLTTIVENNTYQILLCLFGCTFFFCIMGMLSSLIESCKKKHEQLAENIKTEKTFKSLKCWKEKYDQQTRVTTFTFRTPTQSPALSSKKQITLKLKSKFKISSKAISQKDDEEDNKSAIDLEGNETSYNVVDVLCQQEQHSPIETSNGKSMVSIRNMVSKKNINPQHLALPKSNVESSSNVSIDYTSRDTSKKKPTFLSVKKVKTAHNLPKAQFRSNFISKKSIKSGFSKNQFDSVVFVPQQQIPQAYKKHSQPEPESQNHQAQHHKQVQMSLLPIKKSIKNIKSTKSIKSIRNIITTQRFKQEEQE